MATVVQKYSGATAVRTTYSSVYNTSAKGTPAPVAGSQAATYSRPQTTQTTTYNSRGATAPPVSTASAASQAGTVVVKVSGTTTSRITTPAVTVASNRVTTTSGKTTTSKQVGTPAVVATNNVKTTKTGTTATRITTPAVVLPSNVKTTTLNTTATRITTPAAIPMGSVVTTTKKAMVPMVGTPPVVTAIASNGSGNAPDKRVDVLRVHWGNRTQNYEVPTIQKSNPTEERHKKLDRAGYVPFVGDGADFANGVIYAKEGDWINAGISTVAIFIDGATAGRLAKNAAQEATERVARNVAEELGEETVERVGRETAENVAERTGREVVEGGMAPQSINIESDPFRNVNFKKPDIKMVNDVANQVGIDRKEFGNFIHEIKADLGMKPNQNFTYQELLELAEEYKKMTE